MKHTKYENLPTRLEESHLIIKWLQENIDGIKGTSIMVSTNRDGTVREIEIGKSLTKADKKIITDKFPELEGKEVEV